ncbi:MULTISPECIES: hypothetical protein [unclassified Mesorhizobium]|uniref:hypothetical protein n=1 Tax=unclassified Mesorhizobium TaxID=325217 RepID=UPI0011291F51|nr:MULTISPECIES: hypothetical protein [unclassified Mesorhizobium]MBZ9998556.1 hypothetical protein [Mesorhizobium sp. B264B2A]MCA0005101.1 hypothetical protein [Mesorhizobium sp. B264B1B]MCA0019719.1 hypothetical protein [Mesorhizobium sp. B264B1A]TPJ45705.1 hypothetical protein FJ437_15885 [Mesorhizobium sp. B2-6-6]
MLVFEQLFWCSLRRVLWLTLLAASQTSCTPSLDQGPHRLFTSAEEDANLRSQLGLPNFNRYSRLLPGERVSYRNNYITARKYAIDIAYSNYEASLTREQQSVGVLAADANIVLNSAASLAAPVGTKNILSAAAAGLTGAKSAYSDEVLQRSTIQLLQTQMRANRAVVWSNIIRRLGDSDAAYPMALALSDLEEYYRAGTLPGALLKAQATISAAEQIAQDDQQEAIVFNLSTSTAQVLLRNALTQGGKYNFELDHKLQSALRASHPEIKVKLAVIVGDARYSALAAELARDVGLMP